jgi:hypothetical protein
VIDEQQKTLKISNQNEANASNHTSRSSLE